MYRKYKGIRNDDSRRDTVQATLRDVREEARKVVKYSVYDFYELEPAEVDSVLLDESTDQFPKDENGDPNFQYYGAIAASYIVNKNNLSKYYTSRKSSYKYITRFIQVFIPPYNYDKQL